MPHPVVHYEVVGRDAAKLQEFYEKLFDWKIQRMGPEMGNYGMIEEQDGHVGGGIGQTMDGSAGFVTFYVAVDDPQAYLDRAVALGGTLVTPPTDMGFVVFAQFADPEGHLIGLVKQQA